MRKEKEMKRTLAFAVSLTAAYLHGTTLDEARQVIRESFEIIESTQKDYESGIWDSELSKKQSQAFGAIRAFRYDAFPALYEMLQNESENNRLLNLATSMFLNIDGKNPTSDGENEALEWSRKILAMDVTGTWREKDFIRFCSSQYLTLKGNSVKDVELLQRRGDVAWDGKILAARVAGSNVLQSALPDSLMEYNWIPRFYASVTNTGPQAVYVHAILMKFWEQLKAAQDEGFYRIWDLIAEVPEELMTMVVSFDKKGNPVCNVDLAKYGLSMPVIEPKPEKHLPWWDDSYTISFPEVATASLPSADDAPPNRLWLYTALLAILCATAALWLIRKKKRRG